METKDKRRGPSATFWVVLTLGILALAAFVGTMVVKVEGTPRTQLDSMVMCSISDQLKLEIEDEPKRTKIAEIGVQPTFRDLARELYTREIINFETLQKFAGASGAAHDEAPTPENFGLDECIVTGPRDPGVLLEGLDKKELSEFGVLFTSNSKYFDIALDYDEPRIPLVFAGESNSQFMTLEQIEDYLESKGLPRPRLKGKQARELFGKYPFQHISPQ